MPLHLLSKKSWNVYNPAAIARVRADEAAATAREEAHEQQLQEYEAAKRLALLRGQTPPSPPPALEPPEELEKRSHHDGNRDHAALSDRRKRRKLTGEDDTDRDIRVARETEQDRKQRRDGVQLDAGNTAQQRKGGPDVPLVDHAGHIQLFAPPSTREIRAQKDAEAESERKRTQEEKDDRVTMRFSNAAGFRNGPKDVPWYARRSGHSEDDRGYTGTEEIDEQGQAKILGRDAFGNEDPGRSRRDAQRMSAADPMAAMAAAQKTLKQVQSEREALRKEREKDLEDLAEMQEREYRREQKRKRRRGDRSAEDEWLEGFSLDAEPHATRHRRHYKSNGDRPSEDRHRRRSRDRHSQRHRHDSHRTHRERY